MAVNKVKLPAATDDIEVLLKDEKVDAERKYTLRVMTRSAKREARKTTDALEAWQEIEGDESEEYEEQGMRLMCDLLNAILEGSEGAPAPGDLLYDGWLEERVTDDQIIGLVTSLSGVSADPT